jgi:hypothetical protein
MIATAKLSKEFHIAIPRAVCEAQGWQAGQVLGLIPKGKCVLLTPVPHRDALTGIAEGSVVEDYRDRGDRY